MAESGNLHGAEVAITGRLASMTRVEAVDRIDGVGARYVSLPRESTNFLVVGRDGWPFGSDGRLTQSLRVASELQVAGAPIEVVGEESFLELLDPEREGVAPRLYTIGELSRILDVPQRSIRSWVRRGLITPARVQRRLAYFEFREVANARALQRLLSEGATPSQIRHSLDKLEHWLPGASGPIGQLVESDGELLVKLTSGKLAEPSGQLRLAFDDAADAEDELPELPKISQRSQHDWFVEGVRREEREEFEHATEAYHQALLVGPARPEICFNLGNVLHTLRRKGEAAQRFMQAVELDPEYVEAWNNLGNTLAELGRAEKALTAYHRALELEPGYADAHFNLAATLEGLDRHAEARDHWLEYLRQDPNSADADFVRQRLVQLTSD